MNEHRIDAPSPAWRNFTIVGFLVAAGMMTAGIWNMDAPFTVKGFYAMASVMLVQTTVTLTKTLRDDHEARRSDGRKNEVRPERSGDLARD